MKKKLSLFLSILMVLSVLSFPSLNAGATEQERLADIPENSYLVEDGIIEKTVASGTNKFAFAPEDAGRYIYDNLDHDYIAPAGFTANLKQVATLKVKNTYIEDRVLAKCGATIDDFFAKTRRDDNFDGYVMTSVGTVALYDLDQDSDYVVGILNTDEQSPIYDVVFAEDNYDGVVLDNEYYDITTGLVYIYKTDLLKITDDAVYFDYVQAQVLHGYKQSRNTTVVSVSVVNEDAEEDELVVEYEESILDPTVVIPLYKDAQKAYESSLRKKHVSVFINGSDIPLADSEYELRDGCIILETSAANIGSVSVKVEEPGFFENFFHRFFNLLSTPAYAYDYSDKAKYPGVTLTGDIKVGDYVTFQIDSPGYENGKGTTSSYVQTWNSTYNDSTYANNFYRYVALKSGGDLESVEHPSNAPYENDYYIPMARQKSQAIGTRSTSALAGRTTNLLSAVSAITSNLNCGCVHASAALAGNNATTYKTWNYTAMVTALDVTKNYVLVSFLSSERSEGQCLCGSYVFDWKPITVKFEANSGAADKGISQVWQAENSAFTNSTASGASTTTTAYYYYGTKVWFRCKLDTNAIITNNDVTTNTYWGTSFWHSSDSTQYQYPSTSDGVYYVGARTLYAQNHYINVESAFNIVNVVYDPNGGTVNTPYSVDGSSLICRSGARVTSSGAVGEQIGLTDFGSYLYREGHQFKGWSTRKHSVGTGLTDTISTYTGSKSGTVTVYAVWKLNTSHGMQYTYDDATFDSNPGNLVTEKVDLETSSAAYSAPQPSAHGSTFSGYSYDINLGSISAEITAGAPQYLTGFRQVVPGATYTVRADDVTNVLKISNLNFTIEVGYRNLTSLTWNKLQEFSPISRNEILNGYYFTVSTSNDMEKVAREHQLEACIKCTNGTVTYKNLTVHVDEIGDSVLLKASGENPDDNIHLHGGWEDNATAIRLLSGGAEVSSKTIYFANDNVRSVTGEYTVPNYSINSAPTSGTRRLTGWSINTPWTADSGYFKYAAGPVASIYNRLFTTQKDAPIVFAVVRLAGLRSGAYTGYTGPVILSTDPDAVKYMAVETDNNYSSATTYAPADSYLGSFTYESNGKSLTWYMSRFEYWFPYNTSDTLGMANKITIGTDKTGIFSYPSIGSAVLKTIGTEILKTANVRYFDDVLMPGAVIKENESEPFDASLSTVWYSPVNVNVHTRYGTATVYSDSAYTTPTTLPLPEPQNCLYDFVGYYVDVPTATAADSGHNSFTGAASGKKRLQVTDAKGNIVDGYIDGIIRDHAFVNNGGLRLYACFADYITKKGGMTQDMSATGLKRIDFDLNGGKTAEGNVGVGPAYVKGSAVYGSMITPVREGYHFDGWYNGNTRVQSLSGISANTTLTAKWTALSNANKATVVYRLNDGSAFVQKNLLTVTVEKGSLVTITANTPAELTAGNAQFSGHSFTGHKTFVGWSTDPNAPFRDYRAGDQMQVTENTILYAIWR